MPTIQPQPDFKGLAKVLDSDIKGVLAEQAASGFEKAFIVSTAIGKLKASLDENFMRPIMDLQNTKLGFLTDKKESGYPPAVVKECVIEAVLTGVQPYGNMFNIIKGGMYITKEGFGYLLDHLPWVKDWQAVAGVPKMNGAKDACAVTVSVSWELTDGKTGKQDIELAIKWDGGSSFDSIAGKATRKGRAWLFSRITGVEVGEAEVQDISYIEVKEQGITHEDLELLYEMKKPACSEEQKRNFDRILAKKETNNYIKMRDELREL